MALKLQTTFKGLTAEYWKIIKTYHNFVNGKVVVRLALYKDSATRLANVNDFIDLKTFEFDDGDTTRENIYGLIKASKIVDDVETNPFASAEDC